MKFLLSLFLFFYSCNNSQENKPDLYSDLSNRADSILNHSDFNGIVLIAKDSSIVYTKTQGYRDLETKDLLQVNDQFVIGSISKQITAVLILRAYEKGSLDLQDPIGKYLKDIHQDWKNKITIHHLLSHTHGIVALDQMLTFEPGSQFEYSQLGFELLAQILTVVSNKSFLELSQELFQTYGLGQSFHPKSKEYQNLVKGYEENDSAELEYSPYSLENYVAAGSFISTANDLIKWNYLLHSNQLVKPETLELMKTRQATRSHPIFGEVEYGYGLLFKKEEQNTEIGALGYAPGFVSAAYYYPKSTLNLIVLENTARDLSDFQKTFKTHTDLMQLVKHAK
ncbi:MAG: beta-lactamase family protein [Saprospiraceae bacterium]|nr:beta-lactamase family protein [Saprospiraceae bacterium]